MLETLKHENKITKPKLSPKVTKWVLLFAACSSIILSSDKNTFGEKLDIPENDLDPQAEIFYNTLKNEMSFSVNGFIKSIQYKNPDLFLNNQLENHEKRILRLASGNIKKNKLYFPYELSKDNLKDIKTIIPDLTYLLDAMYGEGYSSILNDGTDHSDKELIFDIKKIKNTHILKRLSIEDSKKD